MRLQLVDIKSLPKTSVIDGTPLYTNPIGLIRKFFLKRIELCISLLEVEEGNILDVGCGSGILLPTLSKIKGMIVGIDIHKYLQRVNKYLKKNKFQNICLVQADSHFLPFRKSVFNAIIMISLLDHLHKPRLAINELYQMTNSKGIIIFGFHTNNLFYNITIFVWTILYVAFYIIIFRKFKEVLTNLFKPNNWRHLYSDSILIQWILEKLHVEKQIHLRAVRPVYVAIRSIKKKT
ncbi:MAG: methyltransferase domain-containing protein [Candidatus Helarchaeota archaeon]|nr:methyltransferase domain-containing protein [Candidatus Helarchaeota archaeon]